MENEYESYDDDFDTDFESGIPESPSGSDDALGNTESELDQVVRLLSGEDIDTSGSEAKRNREFSTTNIGADGKRDFSSQSDSVEQASSSESGSKQQHIYGSQIEQMASTAQSEWHDAHREAQRLQDMFESGQLSAEDHHRLSYQQGQRAAAAKEMAYQTRIHELEHGSAIEHNRKMLETELGEDFGADKLHMTMSDMVEFARKSGISDDVLRGVETVEEAGFIYRAMKNQNELQRAQLELKAARQMLKKQNAQLKGRRVKQSKDANVGQRNRDTIEQVADLLAQSGHGHTGRKR